MKWNLEVSNMKHIGITVAFATAFAVTAATPVLVGAQNRADKMSYAVTNLGTLGGTQSAAYGINNLGWVTGAANLEGDQTEHPVLWRNGSIIDLRTLGGDNGSAGFPLKSNLGLVPAFAQTSETDPLGENWNFICSLSGSLCQGTDLVQHGFLWIDGWKLSMPTLGGNNGAAWGANNLGEVVGLAETATVDPNCVAPQVLDYEAVLWTPLKNRMQALPPYPGDTVGAAVGINDNGQVVGATGSCAPVAPAIGAHAVLWENGKVKDLGSLGGAFSNVAYAINNHGQVVGISDLAGDTTAHAFSWRNGTITDLGTLAGDFFSVAFSINNREQVVGESCDVNFNCRAFLGQNGQMIDLNSLVSSGSSLYLLAANDINDRGEIVGQALDQSSGAAPAFLLVPCGEQGTDVKDCQSPTHNEAGTGKPKIALPEMLREQLRRTSLFGRLAAR
jgi:probable HAF family extracellular repeat protein